MQQRVNENGGETPGVPENPDSFVLQRDRVVVNGRTALIVCGVIVLAYLLLRGLGLG